MIREQYGFDTYPIRDRHSLVLRWGTGDTAILFHCLASFEFQKLLSCWSHWCYPAKIVQKEAKCKSIHNHSQSARIQFTTINHPFPNPLTQRVELTLKGELVPVHTVRMTDTNS